MSNTTNTLAQRLGKIGVNHICDGLKSSVGDKLCKGLKQIQINISFFCIIMVYGTAIAPLRRKMENFSVSLKPSISLSLVRGSSLTFGNIFTLSGNAARSVRLYF